MPVIDVLRAMRIIELFLSAFGLDRQWHRLCLACNLIVAF